MINEVSMEKLWNEICGRGKREKPREKPTQTPFRPPGNPHGVTETRTQDLSAVGDERETACATELPPCDFEDTRYWEQMAREH